MSIGQSLQDNIRRHGIENLLIVDVMTGNFINPSCHRDGLETFQELIDSGTHILFVKCDKIDSHRYTILCKKCDKPGTVKMQGNHYCATHALDIKIPLKEEKDVHTEHCTLNGCKYGDDDCPVVLGLKQASYPDSENDLNIF